MPPPAHFLDPFGRHNREVEFGELVVLRHWNYPTTTAQEEVKFYPLRRLNQSALGRLQLI